jgi:hypothetical protein
MSSWMILASAGIVAPNRRRKSSRVPAQMKTSQRAMASLRTRLKNCGESYGICPRPMPLANEGMRVSSMKAFSALDAFDHLTLVPAINTGCVAWRRISSASSTLEVSG